MTALDEALAQYRTLLALTQNARRRVKASPYDRFVGDIGMPVVGKPRADTQAAFDEYFDKLERVLVESFLLRLVATFEAEAFHLLSTAIGSARSTMQQNYPSTSPFSQCTDALVRDTKDIRDLADIEVLLRSYPHAAVDDLAALREHRNKVAHGGRVGKESRFGDPVKVHRTLVDLISIARSR